MAISVSPAWWHFGIAAYPSCKIWTANVCRKICLPPPVERVPVHDSPPNKYQSLAAGNVIDFFFRKGFGVKESYRQVEIGERCSFAVSALSRCFWCLKIGFENSD